MEIIVSVIEEGMTMPRYIDADSALAFPLANGKYDHENANKHFIYGCETYKEYLAQLPTLSPDDVRGEGEWRDKVMSVPGGHGQTYHRYGCTRCKAKVKVKTPYCPSCGAKMKGE